MVIIISTKLFSLQPIGLDTELVESLTSYLSRLADAHCVSVGTLIGKELAPILMKQYLKNSAENGGSRFYNFACEINGLGEQANDFANALSVLTGIERIKELTFIPWKGIFSVREMFKKSKTWCPLCFETSKKNGESIYEPLIWSFKDVNICGIHTVKLEERCPTCTKEIPLLSRKTRNGYCTSCGCWLGSDDTNVFCKYFLYKVASSFCILLQVQNVQSCKFFLQTLVSKMVTSIFPHLFHDPLDNEPLMACF